MIESGLNGLKPLVRHLVGELVRRLGEEDARGELRRDPAADELTDAPPWTTG